MGETKKRLGRPKGSKNARLKPASEKSQSRSVCLYPEEWDQLAAAASDGSATAEAARRLRESIAKMSLVRP